MGNDKAKLKVFANSPVNDISANIKINDKIVDKFPVNLNTQDMLEKEIILNGADYNDILVTFFDSRGVAFENASPKGRGRFKKRSEIREEPIYDIRSSYSLYMTGAFRDRIGETDKAEKLYRQSLLLDKYNPEPFRNLGIMMLSRGRIGYAEDLLKKAVECNKWDGPARYYLALAKFFKGDIDDAYDEAALSSGMYSENVNGDLLAAEALSRKGLYENAVSYLNRASENASLQVKINGLKSALLRRLGRKQEALKEVENAEKTGIEEILIKFEKHFLKSQTSGVDAKALADELHRTPYRFIEAAIDYISMGLYDDAEKVCTIGIELDTYLWNDLLHYNPEKLLPKYKKMP